MTVTLSARAGGAVVVVVLLALSGCRRAGEGESPRAEPQTSATAAGPRGEVVATYKGYTLTSGQVRQEFERLPAPSRTYLASPERKRQFVENMILNDLLYEEGKQAGHDRDPEVERQVNDLRKRLVVQRVLRRYQTPPTVTDDQVRAYYEQNPDLYSTTQIRASHILVKDEESAKQIAAEVKSHPERFAELAREKSTDAATAQRGGDLGTFGQGRMVPEFERVAFALKVAETSEAVKTQYGYHVITVTERKEGERRALDQVKEQIRATLRNQMTQNQVQGHYDALKKEAGLTIDEAALARIDPSTLATPPPTDPLRPPGH
jgi:peptidyl-prolyl cis-trans isomerase C